MIDYGSALRLIGGLSQPSKMPWWGWSISATSCVTGQKLAEHAGTVCSDCYAMKGRYLFPNVLGAHERRLAAIDDPQFVDAFVVVLTNLHAKTRKVRENGQVENRFRWFDSGDLQSVEMLRKINEIALRTPFIDHWLPTREVGIVSEFMASERKAENLVIRVSAPLVGSGLKKRVADLAVATVGCQPVEGVHDCQALAKQGNRCLDCDVCWTSRDVNYPLH